MQQILCIYHMKIKTQILRRAWESIPHSLPQVLQMQNSIGKMLSRVPSCSVDLLTPHSLQLNVECVRLQYHKLSLLLVILQFWKSENLPLVTVRKISGLKKYLLPYIISRLRRILDRRTWIANLEATYLEILRFLETKVVYRTLNSAIIPKNYLSKMTSFWTQEIT